MQTPFLHWKFPGLHALDCYLKKVVEEGRSEKAFHFEGKGKLMLAFQSIPLQFRWRTIKGKTKSQLFQEKSQRNNTKDTNLKWSITRRIRLEVLERVRNG